MQRLCLPVVAGFLTACGWAADGPAGDARPAAAGDRTARAAAINFNRDVRPILADRCFRCHGADGNARKRGLRLDTADGARAVLDSGRRAIAPGDLQASEVARRITSDDPDERMPPPELNLPLTSAQKETLLQWIREGAEYQPHWAFVPPRGATPPMVNEAGWPRDPLDRFVLARLEEERLEHAPQAGREALLRRASLTLTGLPPTPEETAAFVADGAADAYEKQVDRLLASPRFGERMAVDWLDLARFADTFGYQADWECRTWPWRDWVIAAFNQNLPYNQFVQFQVAGDLLPDATRGQRLATAFNRLHRQTNEGGSIDAEFRQEYVSDRVHTLGTAFLGMTTECARCHDHKYDPIPQRDYYSLCAFFGAIDESGTYPYSTGATPRPALRLPTPEQEAELSRLEQAVAAAETEYAEVCAAVRSTVGGWLAGSPAVELAPPIKRFPLDGEIDGPTGKATALDGDSGPAFEGVPAFRRCDPHSLDFWMRTAEFKPRATIIHTSKFTIESDEQGYQAMLKDGRLCWEIVHYWPGSAASIRTTEAFPLDRWVHVAMTYDGSSRANGLRIYLDGQPAKTEIVRDHLDGPAHVRSFQVGFRDRDQGFKGGAVDDLQVFDRELTPLEVAELDRAGALADVIARGEPNQGLVEFYVHNVNQGCRSAAKSLRDARAAQQDLLESIPEIMVMEATHYPRESFVLVRGNYDQPDVSRPVFADRAIEAVLPFDAAWPKNRLGLANWLTDPGNPLVARVEVNRLWAICFGRGIVATLENLGVQGDSPTHPELLDALAADFVAGGWDVKALLRRIVLSATFRQASDLTPQKAARDPQNLLWSRGPSFRLSAETLRDQALAASGLLVEKIGGPSVKPWQPPGLWEDAGANSQGTGGYVPDAGENAHRRSLYTYRKRTAPPPNMLAFDSGSREQCLARRQTTNTPLQPLVLMNDPVFFECARALAVRASGEAGSAPQARIEHAFRLLAAREPRPAEMIALQSLYEGLSRAYTGDGTAAKSVLQSDAADPALAALTLVCSTLMASDAVVTSR
jgi:cytochrome c553